MITEQDLLEAIAECEGQRNPGANTCIKLAAFYTIKEHLFPSQTEEAAQPVEYRQALPSAGSYNDPGPVIDYDSGSEFSNAIHGRDPGDVWPIMDELMDALVAVNPRLYNFVMRKL